METREDIEKKHDLYKTTLSKDFDFFKGERSKKVSRILLIDGGVVIGYFLIKKFFLIKKKDKKSPMNPGIAKESVDESTHFKDSLPFTDVLKNGVAAILLGIAKQKIDGLLERREKQG